MKKMMAVVPAKLVGRAGGGGGAVEAGVKSEEEEEEDKWKGEG